MNSELNQEELDFLKKEQQYYDLLSGDVYSSWLVKGEGKFSPSPKTISKLPPGNYEINKDSQGIFLEKKTVTSDELYVLPYPEFLEIINDIQSFWDNEDSYKKYNFIHKRGILLHGKPGNGKSGIIQLISKKLVEELNGIVINIKNAEELYDYSKIINSIRDIERNTPLIIILEDIDGIIKNEEWIISILLNLLDGVKQVNNIVYIATTNYLDVLEKRIVNRPSRFDRVYEISLPNADIRREYIKNKLSTEDLSNIDIDLWVNSTEDLSLAHLKELIISVIVLNLPFESTLSKLKKLNVSNSINID